MVTTKTVIRSIYLILTLSFLASYAYHHQLTLVQAALGCFIALGFLSSLFAFETLSRKCSLKDLNLLSLGLFSGYLLGTMVFLLIKPLLAETALDFVQSAIFIATTYMGLALVKNQAESWHLTIPFVKFALSPQKRNILLDPELLSDPRLLELAQSGLLDEQLVISSCSLKEWQQGEVQEESGKIKWKKNIEALKKLEALPSLQLRYCEVEVSSTKDPFTSLAQIATFLNAYLLTADPQKIHKAKGENIKCIDINFLSYALKPIALAGAHLSIKIQRQGKEAQQGIGYLEDGTMVVVNGGEKYLGTTIKALVLSVKTTSTGKMIFCNAPDTLAAESLEAENHPRQYFAL